MYVLEVFLCPESKNARLSRLQHSAFHFKWSPECNTPRWSQVRWSELITSPPSTSQVNPSLANPSAPSSSGMIYQKKSIKLILFYVNFMLGLKFTFINRLKEYKLLKLKAYI